jgi:hypothetical protein
MTQFAANHTRTKESENAAFTFVDRPYLRRDLGVVLRRRRPGVPQRFDSARVGRKSLCRIDARHGWGRGVLGGGLFTFYLILTAWLTARRKDGETSKFDWIATLIPLSLGILTWISGVIELRSPEPPKDGDSPAITLLVGSVMLMAVAGDVRMLVCGGVSGRRRIARHLWRMCFGLFIATGSFFLGGANRPLRLLHAIGLRQKPFEVVLRQETLLFFAVLPLPLLIFWMIRIRFSRSYGGTSIRRATPHDVSPVLAP